MVNLDLGFRAYSGALNKEQISTGLTHVTAVTIGQWTPESLDSNLGSTSYKLNDCGKVTQPFWASVTSPVKWVPTSKGD